jgi:hypothetical protein
MRYGIRGLKVVEPLSSLVHSATPEFTGQLGLEGFINAM